MEPARFDTTRGLSGSAGIRTPIILLAKQAFYRWNYGPF